MNSVEESFLKFVLYKPKENPNEYEKKDNSFYFEYGNNRLVRIESFLKIVMQKNKERLKTK